ncbi:MAG: LysR family transcriptional regulator [Myxococcales bacterium]|nr:LysR family transcriptional regulator [Myxococcales bacterium]
MKKTAESAPEPGDFVNLDQLRVLQAIASTGSFAAAGKRLHRATSAVSYGVKGLEERVGFALFDRSGHRAVLTTAGQRLLLEAEQLLERARHFDRVALALRDAWEPSLTIVVDGALDLKPILAAMKGLVQRGLPTRVDLHVEYLSGVRERFNDQRGDLMFVLDFAGDARHVARPLAPLCMRLVVSPTHPLAPVHPRSKKQAKRTRAELAQHVELMVEDSGTVTNASALGRLSLGSPHVLRLGDFHAKLEALVSGIGFGWMPQHLIEDALEQKQLLLLPFEEAEEHRFIPHLSWRRARPLGRAAELFLELLAEQPGWSEG